MFRNETLQISFRPGKLEDAEKLASIQNHNIKHLNILEMPKSSEKIRIAIGSTFLNKNSYLIAEENGEIVGFVEMNKQNNSHVMLSYPYVLINHPQRKAIQKQLIEKSVENLKSYGYNFVSTQVSMRMNEGTTLFKEMGFTEKKPVFQVYTGSINPSDTIDNDGIGFRRVKIDDLDMTYRWINRQLNPLSPIYISKEHFKRLLHAPKEYRDGWSMAIDEKTKQPLAMVSSLVDTNSGDVIIFGPFSAPGHDDVRLKLLNELLWYHLMKGREYIRLMRIELFDNDEELISVFDLDHHEQVEILSRNLE